MTLLNSNVVRSLSLISAGAPAAYGDRAGAVSAATREGSREQFVGHASLALTGLQATLEGPLGGRKTTWLASARKSYVDYVLERLDRNSSLLGFYDATARVTHHATGSQTVSLGWLHGRSSWRNASEGLRPQDASTADAGTDLGTLQWRWAPSSRTELRALGFFSSETGRNRNVDGIDRMRSGRRQWGVRSDATRGIGSQRLEAGLTFRRLEGDVLVREFLRKPAGGYCGVEPGRERPRGERLRAGHLDGARRPADPERGSAGRRLRGHGSAGPSPRLGHVGSSPTACGRRRRSAPTRSSPISSTSTAAAASRAARRAGDACGLEKAPGADTSLRVEAYDLDVDGLFFNPEGEWRVVGEEIAGPDPDAPLRNALAGRSRGFEVLLQRRSAPGPPAGSRTRLGMRAGPTMPVSAGTATSTSATR